ncbi:MAG: pilus assembly protein FimV [Gammaproteobacteria bacterium]|nr:pilus assembly protein FimV [Gammaproteobacteria bacterium]
MKNQNKLIKAAISSIIGVSMLAPAAWGLGLGDIDSDTKLNQPLAARINLLSSKEFQQEDLVARIASFEAYGKFGVIREPVHGQLNFTVETDSDGSKYIRVTSSQAIKEPFLNFLVELNWPQGRLLREYTLLLDPPSLAQNNQQVITAPRPTQAQPIVTNRNQAQETQREVTQSRTDTASQATQNQTSQPRVEFTGDSWRVGRGETLWSIASRVRPDGASVHQTLAALYRNNPNAFINNDIDRLKAGAVLQVPPNSQVRAVASNISYRDLKSTDSVDAPLDVRKTVNETAQQKDESSAGRLTISSVTESDLTDTSGANVQEGAEGDVSQGNQDQLEQTVESLRLENEQLKRELEAVKNQSDVGVALEDETLSVLAGSAEAKDEDDEALQALAAEAEQAVEKSNQAKVAETTAQPVVSVSNNQPQEKAFWQQDGFWKWPLIILGALLALFGLGWVLKKRQSELDQELAADDFSNSNFERRQPSFTSKAPQAPEVETDPLDEADILIARGKLAQVETLLLAVLDKDPDNHVARVKLMEVYSSNQDVEKLKQQFIALPDSFDHDSELGLKVAGLMQLQKDVSQAESVDVAVDDGLMLSEEEVFGANPSEIDTDLSNELDDIFNESKKSVESEESLQEAVDEVVEEVVEDAVADDTHEADSNVIEFSTESEDDALEIDDSDEENGEVLSDDEAHTKLELAKAYIAMGDEESAVEILEEVKKEGSAKQRDAASELLADL